MILAFQAVLSIVRALILYTLRPHATEPIIALAVEPYTPDHSILNTVIAVLMALVSFALAIRAARHSAIPIGLIVVIEIVLCLSLVGDVGVVGQSVSRSTLVFRTFRNSLMSSSWSQRFAYS